MIRLKAERMCQLTDEKCIGADNCHECEIDKKLRANNFAGREWPCWSHAVDTRASMKIVGIEYMMDCDECPSLEPCVAAYGERIYNQWQQDYDPDEEARLMGEDG